MTTASSGRAGPTAAGPDQNSGLIVFCASLAQIMIVLDTTIIAVALPATQVALGFGDSQRQWTITGYTLAFGSMLLLGGRLSRRLGIRVAFTVGLIGFSLASLAGGLAANLGVFLLARVFQGVFAALLAPTNLSLMNVAFPESRTRAKAFAVFGAVAGAGAATGLILGGLLTDLLSWRWCFFVNIPMALVALTLAGRILNRAPGAQRDDGAGDVVGLILGSAGVFGLVLGFSRADPDGWSAATTVGLLAGGVLLLGVFVRRQAVVADPLLPLAIPADPVRAASYLSIMGVGLAQMSSSVYLTYYFQDGLGYSPTRTGLTFLPMVAGLMVAAVLSTRLLVPRLGLRVVYPAGALLQAAAFALLTDLGPTSVWGQNVLVPLVLGGAGLGLVMAPAMSSATCGVPPRFSGPASATANTSQQVGASLGVAFLSTWAVRSVTEALQEHTAATITPALVADLTLRAYESGFAVMAWIAVALALVTAGLLVAGRAGGPGHPPDQVVAGRW